MAADSPAGIPGPRLDLRLYSALVACFVVLGLSVAFSVPVFQIPDENAHWKLGHARAERLLSFRAPACVSTAQLDQWFQLEPMRGHPEKKLLQGKYETLAQVPLECAKTKAEYGDLLTYPGVFAARLLLPGQAEGPVRQVQGILLARLLQGLMLVLALARLGMLARRAERSGLMLLGAFCLSPLLAQQAFGVSSDGVALGFGVSMVAAVLFWEQLGTLDLALFLLFGWGSTAKPFSLPCVLGAVMTGFWYARLRAAGGEMPGMRQVLRELLGTLRPRRHPSRESLFLWAALGLSLATVVLALVNVSAVEVIKPGIDGTAQLAHLRGHPGFALFGLPGFIWPGLWNLESWVGPLGWLDVVTSPEVAAGFGKLLLLALLMEALVLLRSTPRDGALSARALLARAARVTPAFALTLLSVVATVYLVVVVLYLRWTPVGHDTLEGFQMRYLFPVAMLLPVALAGAVQIVLEPLPRRAVGAPATTPLGRAAAALWAWLPPVLVVWLALPLVARVFLDVVARYY